MDFLKLIQEGRVDDFKAKYSQKFGEENIKKILKVVPQKYLDWVGKNMDGVNFDENLSVNLEKSVKRHFKRFQVTFQSLTYTNIKVLVNYFLR